MIAFAVGAYIAVAYTNSLKICAGPLPAQSDIEIAGSPNMMCATVAPITAPKHCVGI